MNPWDTIFGLLAAVLLSTNEPAKKIKDKVDEKYENNYNHSRERYTNMSDKELRREINKLKKSNGDSIVVKVSKVHAIKDEIAERNEER